MDQPNTINTLTASQCEEGKQLLEATTLAHNHLFSFIKSLAVKCAIQLGIPDAINANHGKPMTLSKLARTLPNIHPQKARFLPQLMRILTHLGYFSRQKLHPADTTTTDETNHDYEDQDQQLSSYSYTLSGAGKLLLKDNNNNNLPFSAVPIFLFMLDSTFMKSWLDLSRWFQNDDPTPFQTANGIPLWEYTASTDDDTAGSAGQLNKNINEAMVCDSRLVSRILLNNNNKDLVDRVLDGIETLVDVGGGLGGMARAIAESYPNIHCSVLDLPHVVGGLKGTTTTTGNLTYIAGDMFVDIPPADTVLLKCVLHDWGDEDAVKILKMCKKSVTSNKTAGRRGKVIIINVVVMDDDEEEEKSEQLMLKKETKLFFDMAVMGILGGNERTEKEFQKIFKDAGFEGCYRIYHDVFGFKSLIEVYP